MDVNHRCWRYWAFKRRQIPQGRCHKCPTRPFYISNNGFIALLFCLYLSCMCWRFLQLFPIFYFTPFLDGVCFSCSDNTEKHLDKIWFSGPDLYLSTKVFIFSLSRNPPSARDNLPSIPPPLLPCGAGNEAAQTYCTVPRVWAGIRMCC